MGAGTYKVVPEHAVKSYEGLEQLRYTLAQAEANWSVSGSSRGERAAGTQRIGGCVGLRASVDAWERTVLSLPGNET
jgi:hypothetical protein